MSSRARAMGQHPAGVLTDAGIAARQRALDAEEEGWAGTFLVEPLTALAGGILGGVAVSALAWRLAWAQRRRAALLDLARAVLR